jgi:hypothetical protein
MGLVCPLSEADGLRYESEPHACGVAPSGRARAAV